MIVQYFIHILVSVFFLYYEKNMLKELFGLFNIYNLHFRQYGTGLIMVTLKSLLVSVKIEIIFL